VLYTIDFIVEYFKLSLYKYATNLNIIGSPRRYILDKTVGGFINVLSISYRYG